MNKQIKKSISILLALGINALPLQGIMPYAQAANGINIPSGEQPQILIILDNSQGMAGVIKGPDGLSGAIMSGSGTVAEDASSSSPVYYPAGTDGFIPPATATSAVAGGISVRYSVPCNSSSLTTLGQTACFSFGAGTSSKAYVDNSESMFNVSENAIRYILGQTTYADNIQFGLETYSSYNISLNYTFVYYMSGSGGFSFGDNLTAPKGLESVANPCYKSSQNGYNFINNSCSAIYNYYKYNTYYNNGHPMGNLEVPGLYSDHYLYIKNTSDNPIINDVYYATASQLGYAATNNVGSEPNQPSNYNLSGYETQRINGSYNYYTNGIASGSSPTSAGYIPTSQQVWNSQRGYGFNASTSGSSGNLVVAITASNAQNNSNIYNAIVPEVLDPNIYSYPTNPITASAGHAPVAGAFQTALNYFQGNSSQASAPPTTCGKKYVIFITFGQPTKGIGANGSGTAYVYPPLGSAAAKTFGVPPVTAAMVSATTTTNNGLTSTNPNNNNAVTEAITSIQNLYAGGVKTYVIGVGSAVNPSANGTPNQQAVAQQGQYVLQAMANAGGTNTLYTATSSSQLQSALNNIVANILGKSVVSSYAAPPSVTVGSLEFLLKNVNPVTGQGDLYAYPVTSNGSVSSTASWDANSNMTAATRSAVLYTTPLDNTTTNGGSVQTFPAVASTDSAAFGTTLPPNLTASDIAQYTINPSYDNGTYLGGRDSGWYVGLPSSAPAEVLTAPNNASLLNNAGYLSFASGHANRQNAVLFSDNDGFLYALGYQNVDTSSSSAPTGPTLLWGWMPGALLPSLQNYPSFWQGNNMGNFASIDAYDNSDSKWHTYVVGVAGNGSIYYDLQLTGTRAPDLGNVVAQYNYSGYSQPVASAPVFYQVNTPGASNFGQTWALFAINNSSGSNLGILNVSSGTFRLDPLPISNTATPYIDSNGNLFLGNGSGNVYEITAANLYTVLSSKNSKLIPSQDFTSVGNYTANWPSGLNTNVQFIGGTFYQGKNYLRVQGPSGITLFSNSTGIWSPVWTTYSGGAGEWSGSSASSYTSNTTITPLPSGSTITDQALINSGNVIVPVTVPPSSTDTCGVNTAAYYIYSLVNGIFPSSAYVSTGGTPITLDAQGGYVIGQGNALTPSVTVFNGSLLLQGAASKNTTGGTSGFASALGVGLPLGGPVAWRLVLQH